MKSMNAYFALGVLCLVLFGCSEQSSSGNIESNENEPESIPSIWSAELISDAMTDEETMAVFAEGDPLDYQSLENPVLTIYQPTTGMIQSSVALIEWNDYLGSGSQIWVNIRIDDQESDRSHWLMGSNGTSAWIYMDASDVYMHEWLEAERIRIQITPYGENPQTAEWDMYGFEEALAEHENWSFIDPAILPDRPDKE